MGSIGGPKSDQCHAFFLCNGSECRKKRKSQKSLRALLGKEGQVCEVRCQKICKGPVVGVEVDGRLEWFSKMTGQDQDALVQLLRHGDIKKRLRARMDKKRRGKLRTKSGSFQHSAKEASI